MGSMVFNCLEPIIINGGDLNLYRYVGNNPVNFLDLLGLAPLVPVNETGSLTYDPTNRILIDERALGQKNRDWLSSLPPGWDPLTSPGVRIVGGVCQLITSYVAIGVGAFGVGTTGNPLAYVEMTWGFASHGLAVYNISRGRQWHGYSDTPLFDERDPQFIYQELPTE
jgi:hypothetical protein